jgi:hypothetical protein
MTQDEKTTADIRPRPILAQTLIYIGFCLFAGGLGAGAMSATREGVSLQLVGVVGIVSGLGAAATYAGVRLGNFDPPSLTNRAGRSQLVLLASGLIGGLISIYLMQTGAYDRMLAGEFTPTTAEAAFALALLFLVLLPIGFVWQHNIDEHEDSAVKTAAYFALGSYMYIYLGWSIAALAGWTPTVHVLGLFVTVMFIFVAVWVVKRAG